MTEGWATVTELVAAQAHTRPHSVAIAAPGLPPLSHGELRGLVERTTAALRGLGIDRGDVVGIVLPNGPHAATAFLAVSAAAAAAPLNPGYPEPEFEFYMSDLGMRAVVVPAETDSPAVDVAARLGVEIVRLQPDAGGGAGAFQLNGVGSEEAPGGTPHPDDVALVLHTSGTTSAPKMVPLRHRNIAASAQHIASTLRLTGTDRCLNVMPLFHIHGLMAAVMASLSGGGSVYCTPGFVAPRFFDWTDESRATWYTAVPTMHQAILDRAPDHADIIARSQLRFARSSSASLAPQVMARLEATLGVPVIEAYGMTEAAHQMTSNPLPPDARKPGSVGPQAGPDVAVMSNDGSFVAAGQEGEIVIRGSNVMDGYAAAAHVNEAAFHGGWFRTGDLGRLDEDGYLTISGRIKEIINRGGETISPREIDETLLEHPGVAQALTFAVPDERLGEQVAAAVVPAAGSRASETDLRRHVSNRLATAKVPRRIVFLDDIPKGPTGKLQRIGLATRLGLENLDGVVDAAVAHTAPRTAAETLLAGLWTEVLGLAEPSVHDRFLDVGGDSVLATRLIARVDAALGFTLDMIEFFDRPTIAEQAALIEDMLLEAESRHGR